MLLPSFALLRHTYWRYYSAHADAAIYQPRFTYYDMPVITLPMPLPLRRHADFFSRLRL